MTRVKGFIHEIKDGKARCRRGKYGKVDYWMPLEILTGEAADPLRSLVSAVATGYRNSSSTDDEDTKRLKKPKPKPKKKEKKEKKDEVPKLRGKPTKP